MSRHHREDARPSELDQLRNTVQRFVAVGADESVQRVIAAVHRLSRRLDKWYDQQMAALGSSAGEWSVLNELVRAGDQLLTPSQLAAAVEVAPSSMTHRLDRMAERNLITRTQDPNNRTRVLVGLTADGYRLYVLAIQDANVVEVDVLAALDRSERDQLADLLEQAITGLDKTAV